MVFLLKQILFVNSVMYYPNEPAEHSTTKDINMQKRTSVKAKEIQTFHTVVRTF